LAQTDARLQGELEREAQWMLARAVALLLALAALAVIFARMLNRLSGVRTVLAGQVRSREAAERAVRSNEAVLQSMNDASPMGMFVTDEAGSCTYANLAFERITGLISSAIRADGWQNAIHPDDRDRVVSAWRTAIATRAPFSSEHRFLHRKGRVVWVAMSATTMFEGTQAIGLVCTVQDVTALREAADNLRRSNERLQIALESSKLGLIDWHLPSGEIVLGDRWGAILGERNEQTTTTARRLSELLHPDDREGLRQQLIAVLKGKSASLETEFRLRTSDSQWKAVTCHGRVTERDKLGRAVQFAGTFAESAGRRS
jgi:PAS domain S-box-containing protein